MKNITISHYVVKDIEPEPWQETWTNLLGFAQRMDPKLEPMGIRLHLVKIILQCATQDNLMMGNMVTIESPELATPETPIENLLMLDLDYSECAGCVTENGTVFPCRTFVDFDGVARQALPEEFFMEAILRVAFKAENEACSCSDCSACAGGCENEGQDAEIHDRDHKED